VAVAVGCTSALNLIWSRVTADQFASSTLTLCSFDLLDTKFSNNYGNPLSFHSVLCHSLLGAIAGTP
jgi:hypothetical protein